jgi:hypothetical protein
MATTETWPLSPGASAPIRVAVLGARGKVGSEICRAVAAAPDLMLARQITRGDPLHTLTPDTVDVAVDFTEPGSLSVRLEALMSQGIHCVVGTTGFGEHVLTAIERLGLPRHRMSGCWSLRISPWARSWRCGSPRARRPSLNRSS